ncbi:MAG: hypothetical protein KDI44_12635 [Thiothrix sp.]|nr:hypothetical protein [Thiothrix sp.]HPQ96652.1 hypothetical protein [Thiolinea sp.]
MRLTTTTLVALIALSGFNSALADQCAYISQQEAAAALDHIKPGTEFLPYCEPCDDPAPDSKAVQSVQALKAAPTGYENTWEISINGKGIDLAYTFVKRVDGSFLNLSKLAGCPSDDVSFGLPPLR